MYKKTMTLARIFAVGLTIAATSFASMAANVPAGVKLAAKQELVRGNGSEVA